MIINYIKLENFRQFKGKNVIEFSTDPKKKATLIIAKNGTGKTTLLESFAWILYGTCNLKTIINSQLKTSLRPNTSEKIYGEIGLTHLGKKYVIIREATVYKPNVKPLIDDPRLSLSMREKDGTTKHFSESEAQQTINEIVPKTLFPYFFFKGESIERIGKEISEGKNSKNSEFVKAIKGMLGFDYLYQEQSDLSRLIKEYQVELEENNNDDNLQAIQKRINDATKIRDDNSKLMKECRKNIDIYKDRRKRISDEILKSGDVTSKQKESLNLAVEIRRQESAIYNTRKDIFSKFSSRSFKLLAQKLIAETCDFLDKNGDINKGIPGINASAVKYILKQGECICGTKFDENDKHYKKLNELMKYLPPNNLGAEITKFKEIGKLFADNGNDYLEDHVDSRKLLQRQTQSIQSMTNKLRKLNEEIKSFPDMTAKKSEEMKLESRIQEEERNYGGYESRYNDACNEIEAAEKEKSGYKIVDSHINKLRECEWQTRMLLTRVTNFCNKKEKEKRGELESAINEIFAKIFDIDIKIRLNDDYGITLFSGENVSISEFEESTSQDAIMAFSFIGGIIKLARDKSNKKIIENNLEEIDDSGFDTEPYPLVMDAPSSSFDIERIENFCKIMPNIAEQVIFFIKDTDGLYVKKYLSKIIGKEYQMKTVSKTETCVDEEK